MALEEKRVQFKEPKELSNNIILNNRKKLSVSGVSEVDSFSDTDVIADTALGKLCVKGEGLKISKLSVETGELTVEGKINSIEYTKKKEKGGFFENIFR